MNNLFRFLLLVLISNPAVSQQLYEDAFGESTLYIDQTSFSFFRFNSNKASIKLGLNYITQAGTEGDNPDEPTRLFYGGDVKVDLKDQKGQLFNLDKGFFPGIKFSGNIGISVESDPERGKYYSESYFIRGSVGLKDFKFITDTNSIINQFEFEKKKMWLGEIGVYANYIFSQSHNNNLDLDNYHVMGIGLVFLGKDNFDNLSDINLTSTILNSSNQSISKSESGKLGNLKFYNSISLSFDYGFMPELKSKKNDDSNFLIGFNAFYRGSLNEEKKFVSNAGIGLFIPKPNSLASVLGGIAIQINDVFKVSDSSTDNFFDRGILFAYAGFSIN